MTTFTESELRALAAQLACPHGAGAAAIAEDMAQKNQAMTWHAIEHLPIEPNQFVLELGHGGAPHLVDFFARYPRSFYVGWEKSQAMHDLAEMVNQPFIASRRAEFRHYDGETLPSPTIGIHHIFTVNTLYFWSNVGDMLHGLFLLLEPGGVLNITYSEPDFMSQLPFSRFGFSLYDRGDVEFYSSMTTLELIGHFSGVDHIKSATGAIVERPFVTTSFRRPLGV